MFNNKSFESCGQIYDQHGVIIGGIVKKLLFNMELNIALIVLSEAVRKNPLTSRITVVEAEQHIKAWLRGAGDRKGGRMARLKKVAATKKAAERCSSSRDRQDLRRSSHQSRSPSPAGGNLTHPNIST
jgi:hypothetical protein